MPYTIGLDFGTDSLRALIVDVDSGEEVGMSVAEYERWKSQKYCNPLNNQFRQHPKDYINAMKKAINQALNSVEDHVRLNVIGIGVDTTGSTPCPVNAAGIPLAMLPEFEDGDRSSRRLTVPNTFDIQYMYNNKENGYLHKISTCVLESCDVKYSGEGKYQTFTADGEGAPPMVTEMSLNFQEMEIITKERVAEGY